MNQISPLTTLTSSEQIRDTAEQFIAHFSQSEPSNAPTSPWKELSEQDKQRLVNDLKPCEERSTHSYDDNVLLKGTGYYYMGRGKHHNVWGHQDFPDRVFKRMDSETALTQVQVAKATHGFVSKQNPFWCRCPFAEIIELPNSKEVLYVEEKLHIGMSLNEHDEFWTRIFIHLDSSECSPLFKENLFALVKQINILIEEFGFWDVGLHNLPEVAYNGTYVCVTDFENIDPNKKSLPDGMRRLASLFCHHSFQTYFSERYKQAALEIQSQWEIDNYNQRKTLYGEDCDWINQPKSPEQLMSDFHDGVSRGQQSTSAKKEALIAYDQKGWIDGSEQNIPSTFDTKEMTEKQIQVAQQLLSKFQNQLKSDKNEPITQKRQFYAQAYSYDCSTEILAQVMGHLKSQGILMSWYQSSDDCFTMWF